MDKLNIRQVTIEDTKDILKIYEPYILNTPITFEYDVPSIKEFEERIRKITSKYPYLVCEENNEIIDVYKRQSFICSKLPTSHL